MGYFLNSNKILGESNLVKVMNDFYRLSSVAITKCACGIATSTTRIAALSLSLTTFGLFSTTPVDALTLITQRSVLGASDQVNWQSQGKIYNPFAPPPPNPNDFVGNNFTIASQGGLGLSVSIPAVSPPISPPFVLKVGSPPTGVPANFAIGDYVLFGGLNGAAGFPAPGNQGPITITFDKPVWGAGTQIAVDDTPSFNAFLDVYNSIGVLLQTFTVAGVSSTSPDNSAQFLGFLSDSPNIGKIIYRTDTPNRAIAINQLGIVSVPEPSMGVGLLILLGGGMIRLRTSSSRLSLYSLMGKVSV